MLARGGITKRKKKGKDLAKALGCSSQNIYARLKRDSWKESQLRKIGEALDCDLHMYFELRDTKERF